MVVAGEDVEEEENVLVEVGGGVVVTAKHNLLYSNNIYLTIMIYQYPSRTYVFLGKALRTNQIHLQVSS